MGRQVSLWHIPAGCGPACERLLLGLDLPLVAHLAAIATGTAASDALPDRLMVP